MPFSYTLNGNDIVLYPASAVLYRDGSLQLEVNEMAQRRANATGKPVQVFAMDAWGLTLGDVVFTAKPETT